MIMIIISHSHTSTKCETKEVCTSIRWSRNTSSTIWSHVSGLVIFNSNSSHNHTDINQNSKFICVFKLINSLIFWLKNLNSKLFIYFLRNRDLFASSNIEWSSQMIISSVALKCAWTIAKFSCIIFFFFSRLNGWLY